MNTAVLKFTATGLASCLYTEIIDLAAIGQLEITRASNIEFNNQTQLWEVTNPQGRVLHSARSRSACLEWEQENL